MNIADLDPLVQCEVLRLAHDYATRQREQLSRDRKEPKKEGEWYGDQITNATKQMLSLYE